MNSNYYFIYYFKFTAIQGYFIRYKTEIAYFFVIVNFITINVIETHLMINFYGFLFVHY